MRGIHATFKALFNILYSIYYIILNKVGMITIKGVLQIITKSTDAFIHHCDYAKMAAILVFFCLLAN